MRLYSVQPRFVYDILQSKGWFLSQPHKGGVEWVFADSPPQQLAYEWLCKEMQNRGLTRPANDVYPIWAWLYYQGPSRAKPDLRGSGMKIEAKENRSVHLTLEVPDDQVLLHDFHAWHYPLNYWHIGTAQAGKDFESRCKRAGCPLHSEVPLADSQLREEIEESWKVIFYLVVVRKRFRIAEAKQQVQATFWELRAEHIVEAVEFGRGRPKQRLPLPTDY